MAMQEPRQVKGLLCKHCGVVCPNMPSLLEHMDRHLQPEEEDLKFKCEECGRGYRHAGSLANHKKTHEVGSFQCPICTRKLSNTLALKNHLRIHTSRKKYSGQVSRKDHAEHTRGGNSFSTSAMPELIPSSASDSDRAAAEDAEDRPFKCGLCEKTYRHHGSLINHKKTHQLGTFECPVCFKQFNNLAALNSHQRIHSKTRGRPGGAAPEAPAAVRPPQNGDAAAHLCHLCQVAFPSEDEFRDHVLLHNSSSASFELAAGVPDGRFPYHATRSPESDTPLLDKRGAYEPPAENGAVYLAHPYHHEPPAPDTQGEPRASAAHHLNPLPVKEEECCSPGSDRRFKCNVCGKSYRHAGSLINHKRSHQTGVYQCSICRKNYPHLAALRSHLRIHRAQTSASSHGAEGDWLSSEPLTHENQPGGFTAHEGDVGTMLDLPQDLGDADHMIPGDHGHAGNRDDEQGTAGFRFDVNFSHDQPVSHVCPLLRDPAQGYYYSEQSFHRNVHKQMAAGSRDQVHAGDEEDGGEEEEDGDMYHCSVCGNHYTSMRALRTHLRGHTQIHGTPSSSGPSSMSSMEAEKEEEPGGCQQGGASLIICSTCGESFITKQDLLAHQLLHDGSPGEEENPPYPSEGGEGALKLVPKQEMESIICGKCGIACLSFHHLESHACSGQREGCAQPGDCKLDAAAFDGPDSGTMEDGPCCGGGRLYTCDQCGRSYRHAGSLLNHKKSHKTGVFRCYVCQKRFYNLLALKNHQRTHFDVKKHRCSECGKAFKIHKQLLNHLRVHQENKAKIQELNRQIQTLMQMNGELAQNGLRALGSRKAQRRRRRDAPPAEKDAQGADSDDPRPFVCDQCGRSYRHAGSLVNHKNSHKTGEYYCAVCNNTYSNQLAMKNHLRIHFAAKKHSCPECGRAFRGRKQLQSHRCSAKRRSQPAGGARGRGRRRPRELACKQCREVFTSADQLTEHACPAPKNEERPFKCAVCGRSYRHAGSLLNHKNTHKTGHFSCTFCAKPFSNPMALRNHTRIHTQKKKHVCPTCGKAFRLSSILHNHLKIHARGHAHLSCQTCGKSFQGRSGLKRHRCVGGQSDASKAAAAPDTGDKCYM
uniref:C2H2-type domain-containing protein n=1 Tax=Denticeps clupeoides TaxID=299321 RepID=A0AAY4ASJ1_9TELE